MSRVPSFGCWPSPRDGGDGRRRISAGRARLCWLGTGRRGAGAGARRTRRGTRPRAVVIGPSAPVPPEVAMLRPDRRRDLADQRGADEIRRDRQVVGEEPAQEIPDAAQGGSRRGSTRPPRSPRPDQRGGRTDTRGSSRSRRRAASTCCSTATRSPTGGSRATRTRRCSTVFRQYEGRQLRHRG